MTLIAEPQPECERAYHPRKRSVIWRFPKRLVELVLIVRGICLAWLRHAWQRPALAVFLAHDLVGKPVPTFPDHA
jgi:hypothetical protein